nr:MULTISPECIES: hypothetical protein [Streptomyces]
MPGERRYRPDTSSDDAPLVLDTRLWFTTRVVLLAIACVAFFVNLSYFV